VQEFADVFDSGEVHEVVPRLMVVLGEDLLDDSFQVCEIHQHALTWGSFDDAFDFVGMPVRCAAFRMSGKEVSAIDVVHDTDLHVWQAE
jgi:hypothetical protein